MQTVLGEVIPNPDNAVRYQSQPRWFDFYNCRVVLPDQDLFFFMMPYLLSGADVPEERTGLYLLDGSNGGRERQIRTGKERVAASDWSASSEGCGVSWSKGDEDSVFTETYIRATSPNSRWEIEIEPFLSDRAEPIADLRRFELEERLILRRVPFIHRVPHMKGHASGTIAFGGERYSFERGVVYQAKNHGPALPERWIWLHANAFADDETLAFEIASNPAQGGDAAMVRIVRPSALRSLTTWEGDTVQLSRSDGRYTFSAASADGALTVSGEAIHGASAVFDVPAPEGGTFEIDEDLTGHLTVEIDGDTFTTQHAAVGVAHRKPHP